MAKKKKSTGKSKVKVGINLRAARPIIALKAVTKPRTKSDILNSLAGATGLSRKEISNVMGSLQEMIGMDVGKKGPGLFIMPGMMKIMRHTKPATKARRGVNPFTGEEMMFKAKPARNVIKVRPLKALKAMV